MNSEGDLGQEVARLGGRLSDTMGAGFTSLAIALGVELGLLEKMVTYDEPKLSTQLASDTNCKERYVREWLNLLVASDWLVYDEGAQSYSMTPAQKEIFKSPFTYFFPVMQHSTFLYSSVIKCFKMEGSNGFDPEGLLNGHLADWNVKLDSKEYVSGFLNTVPEMVEKLEQNGKICEIGCGIGSQLIVMASCYPDGKFIGCDLSSPIIDRARKLTQQRHWDNVTFEVHDAAALPTAWTQTFDVVLVRDVIHDLPNAYEVLREIRRIMKSDAIFVMADRYSHSCASDDKGMPGASLLYGCSLFNCLPSAMNAENPAGLGTMWGHVKANSVLEMSGFSVQPYRVHGSYMVFVSVKN